MYLPFRRKKILTARYSRREVFCKKDVLEKFCKTRSKTPVAESLFNKVTGLRPANLSKRGSGTAVFL